MLDELNRYGHGYVAIPVAIACKRGGLFELLRREEAVAVEAAASALGANSGYLRIAWRLLRSLGWLERTDGDDFRLTDSAAVIDQIPDDAVDWLQFPVEQYLDGADSLSLKTLVEGSGSRWGMTDPVVADLIDGVVVVPLLIELAKRDTSDPDTLLRGLPARVREELGELFTNKGWTIGGDEITLTPEGRFMVERAMNMGVVLSYKSLILRLKELLFGDGQEVFSRLDSGDEGHVDRTLNVIGSGFQHEKYFRDLDAIILSIFDSQPISDQPKYVADMGCGDGTLLKRVYDVVSRKSQRGKVLDEYPLTMIGLDYNQASLNETERTLADIPHITMRADIGDPAKMLEDLRAIGIEQPEEILHIRSFLDHDRPYKAPADTDAAAARRSHRYEGVFVDTDGQDIAAADAVQSLTEHFEGWSALGSRHGLIIIEVHSLGPDIVNAYLSESENLHFDALQAFSGQLLVEAETFLLSAAEAGLFPRSEFGLKYPKVMPFCRITQNWYENRPYRARHARPHDIPALLALEEACWPEPLRTSEDVLTERLRSVPDGNLVFEVDGRVAGVIYTQPVDDIDRLWRTGYEDIDQLRSAGGQAIQLISFNIDPSQQGQGLGDQFLDFVLQWLRVKPGVRSVVGVSRCRNFEESDLPLDEYIHSRDANGELLDPILRFHNQHGAAILGLVPGYRPLDSANQGAGVMIQYELEGGVQAQQPSAVEPAVGETSDKEGLSLAAVEEMLATLLGPARGKAISADRPLKAIGLDSLDLLEFRTMLGRRVGRKIEPTFFFQYSTPRAISDFFSGESGRRPTVSSGRLPVDSGEPIAIVGASCRFPGGANDLDEFWELLINGRDAIVEVPPDRSRSESHGADATEPWRQATRYGGFLDDVDLFDSRFFDIAPREANLMDPQQRILLELSWEALENSGIDPESLAGSDAGVFAGVFTHDYEYLQLVSGPDSVSDMYFATGTNSSVAAGRIAYVFGLHGPALAVNTACSSSLVAVHMACQSIRNRECSLALASGVNLMLAPQLSETFAKANMLAPDGRCKTFDAAANGYVRSEGAAVVVLKSLSQAQADGDRILAVIRGSAINQDGASNGLTAPSAFAQQDVIERALQNAKLEPQDVSYVEAHGTGTSLGDPVEVSAINAVYGGVRDAQHPLILGSLKTNVGHMESTAGIGGLLKVALALQHRRIPQHLHFEQPNPHLDLDLIPAQVPIENLPWQADEHGRRIGAVSSFGFSGTNAHVIVEAAPTVDVVEPGDERPVHLLTLSARDSHALAEQAGRFADCLENSGEDTNVGDICYSANVGRAHLEHRLAVAGDSKSALAGQLRFIAGGDSPDPSWATTAVAGARGSVGIDYRSVFLFGGHGGPDVVGGRELFDTHPTFRRAFQRCDDVVSEALGTSLVDVLRSGGESAELNEPRFQLPLLFAVQHALYELWRSWGLEPELLAGHGQGEIAAAVAAGVFSVEDALKLVLARSEVAQATASTRGLIAALGEIETVEEILEPFETEASVAAVNAPNAVVLCATEGALAKIVEDCTRRDIKTVPLRSHRVPCLPADDVALDALEGTLASISYSMPKTRLISGLSGRIAGQEVATPAYWRDQSVEPIQFATALETLRHLRPDAVIEISPAPTLTGLVRSSLGNTRSRGGRPVECLASLQPGRSEWQQLLLSLGRLYVTGADVDWRAFDGDYSRSKVALPGYAFQRERFWFDQLATHKAGEDAGALPGSSIETPDLIRLLRESRVSDRTDADRLAGDINPALDRICSDYVIRALRELGWQAAAGDRVSGDQLLRELGILERHDELVGRMLEMLGEDGYLAAEGESWVVRQAPPVGDVDDAIETLMRENSEFGVEIELLKRCADKLPDVLRGDADPLQLIFPDGDLVGATQFYENTPFSRDCNAMMKAAISALAETSSAEKPLRILEIGAGTGGTTSHLLPCLPAEHAEYVFTDVSPLFTAGAAEKFVEYPFVSYELLDIGKDPASQGFARGSFDVVLASNVLHATPDLRRSLKHARELLAPGGRLLLVEGTDKARWIDLIFGLTEGWWLFDDWDLRPDHPLVSQSDWPLVLESCGYTDAHAVPNSDQRGGALFQQSLVMGRQPETAAEPVATAGRLLGAVVNPAREPNVYLFDSIVDLDRFPWLRDHRVDDNVIFPASAYMEMSLAAAVELPDAFAYSLQNLELREAMFLEDEDSRHVQLVAVRDEDGQYAIEIYSARTDDSGGASQTWQLHATGILAKKTGLAKGAETADGDADSQLDQEGHYDAMSRTGLDYGPQFRAVQAVSSGSGFVSAELDAVNGHDASFVIHPALADAALQLSVALAHREYEGFGLPSLWLPVGCHEACLLEPVGAGDGLRAIATPSDHEQGSGRFGADVTLFGAHGRPVYVVKGLELKRVERSVLAESHRILYRVVWLPKAIDESVRESEPSRWLIAAGSAELEGAARETANALRQEGVDCDVLPAAPYGNGQSAAELADRLTSLRAERDASWRHVVYFAAAEDDVGEASDTRSDPMTDQKSFCGGLLHLAQGLIRSEDASPQSLYVLTRCAQATGDEPAGLSLTQTTLSGLRRVIAVEHPELNCRQVDLDSGTAPGGVAAVLLAESSSDDGEDEIAYRGGLRFASRLIRHTQLPPAGVDWQSVAPGRPVELTVTQRGTPQGLRLVPTEMPTPAAGEVTVRVRTTGLNFKDVMNVVGFRDDSARLGLECTGVVAAVGDGVTNVRPGDPVMAAGPGSFATYLTTNAALVAKQPPNLSPEQAATVPIAFLTAWFGLRHLTSIKPGERVLIHAASGGVGLAAVQLAKADGAVVFGTAGSDRKRAYLESIGVDHVLDSRSLSFADEVTRLTDGEGVDVVLNCLAGEFITKSFDVLARGGRFVELGIRDIWSAEQVAAARPDVRYETVDLSETMRESPEVLGPMFESISDCVTGGELRALPLTSFPIERVISAFGFMQNARHIGKIIVTQPATGGGGRLYDDAFVDGTHLITGGLGPLGIATARWLAGKGARHLVLLGRSEPSDEAAGMLDTLRAAGVSVAVHSCDITRRSELEAVLESTAASMPPLRGVYHLAGTLADGVLMEQTWDRFETVLGPKVLGAWNLHELTRDMPLASFVLYSSWSSMLGSAGQANHSSANAFLDALAHHRNALGMPGLSVNWAAWTGSGAAMYGDRLEQLASRGIGSFSAETGLEMLGQLMAQGAPQVAVMPFDLDKWRSRSSSADASHRFDELVEDARDQEAAESGVSLGELLEAAGTEAERLQLLRDFLVEQLAETLNTLPSTIETDASFRSLGLDSLTGLELRNRLETRSGLGLSATIVWNYPSVDRLAEFLDGKLREDEEPEAEAPPQEETDEPDLEALLEELESVSDEEAGRLLAESQRKGLVE